MSDYKLVQFLESIFDSCDITKSGTASSSLLRSITQNLPAGDSGEAQALFTGGDHPITRHDYVDTMKHAIVIEIGSVFAEYDSDEDNILSESELVSVLTDLNSTQTASEVISQYDTAKIGGLDRQSFLQFFISNLVSQSTTATKSSSNVPPEILNAVKSLGLSETEITNYLKMFTDCDSDHDGKLSVRDIEISLSRRNNVGIIDPSKLVNYLDDNWSGYVEFDEFVRGSQKIRRASNGSVNLGALLSAASIPGVSAQLMALAGIVMGGSSGSEGAAGGAGAAGIGSVGPQIGSLSGVGSLQAGISSLSVKKSMIGSVAGGAGAGGQDGLDRLNEEIHNLSMAKAVAEERLLTCQKECEELKTKYNLIQKKYNEINSENKKSNDKIKKLENDLRECSVKIKKLEDSLSESQVNIKVLKGKLATATFAAATPAAVSSSSSSSTVAANNSAILTDVSASSTSTELSFFSDKKDDKKIIQELKDKNDSLEREIASLRDLLDKAKAAVDEEHDIEKTRAILNSTDSINAGSAAALLDRISKLEKECEDLKKANAAAVRGNTDLRKYNKLAEDLKAQTEISNTFSKEITTLRAQVMVLRGQVSGSPSADLAAAVENSKVYVDLERILAGEQVPVGAQEPQALAAARRVMKTLAELRSDAAAARKELAEIVPGTGATQNLREAAEAARREYRVAKAAAAAAAESGASASEHEDELRRLRSENIALNKQIENMSASGQSNDINTPLLESFQSIVKRRTPANNRMIAMIVIAAVIGLVVGCLLIFFILSGVCGSMNFKNCKS